jgi:fructoselysine and glucoselysine-specific PTS system IIA component
MKQKLLTFLVSHENLSKSLLRSVKKILGPQKKVFTFSNQSDSLPILAKQIADIISKYSDHSVVFFTDLKGGSCWTLGQMIKKEYPQIIIISGVNLPMLITYFNNTEILKVPELAAKSAEDGCRGIVYSGDS